MYPHLQYQQHQSAQFGHHNVPLAHRYQPQQPLQPFPPYGHIGPPPHVLHPLDSHHLLAQQQHQQQQHQQQQQQHQQQQQQQQQQLRHQREKTPLGGSAQLNDYGRASSAARHTQEEREGNDGAGRGGKDGINATPALMAEEKAAPQAENGTVGSKGKDMFRRLYSREFVGHKKKVHSVVWNCLGDKLASGSTDQTIRVWPIPSSSSSSSRPSAGRRESGRDRERERERERERDRDRSEREVELRGHTESVDNLCWDPNQPAVLASASQDKTVRIWDTRAGKCSQSVTLKGENINVAFSPDGRHLAVGNNFDELTILDARKLKTLSKHSFDCELNECAWDNSGSLFFVTLGTGCVEVYSYPSMRLLDTIAAHTTGVYSIAIDPLGRYFAIGAADALVSMWDIRSMLCVRMFTKLDWPVRTVSFSHDGQFLASGSEDLFVDIADVETGRSVYQIQAWAAMNSVAWNPKHLLLAYASDDENKHSSPGVIRVFGFESP